MSTQEHLQRLEGRGYNWPVPWEVVAMMCEREGCELASYLCPSNVWTIGWGETRGVKRGMSWTAEQADQALLSRVEELAQDVAASLLVNPTRNQLGSMVSLAYNIGMGQEGGKRGFLPSSVRRHHNAGNFAAAADAFLLFTKGRVGGALVELPGLVTRRRFERDLYLKP